MSVMERFDALKAERPHLLLCALVDGLVFEQVHGQRLEPSSGCAALFDGTDDAALAYAGPWAVDAGEQRDLCDQLLAQEAAAPQVSWLIAGVPFDGLVQLLRLKLDVRLPDGSIGLLRFYDPRVLYSLATTLTDHQREEFFGHVHEWHFMHNGQALRIGRADA
jgi:Domain of unknown function (DUF4123)